MKNGAYFSIRSLHNFYYPVQLGVLKANARFFLLKRILFMVAGAHIFEKVKNYDCRHQLEKLKAEKEWSEICDPQLVLFCAISSDLL